MIGKSGPGEVLRDEILELWRVKVWWILLAKLLVDIPQEKRGLTCVTKKILRILDTEDHSR